MQSFDEIQNLKGEIESLKFEIRKWKKLAERDDLTGCLRRAAFLDLITERKQFGLLPQRASLVVIDIDHFKKINDSFGHAAGDEVLSLLGHYLTEAFQHVGLVCRMGGEEFVVCVALSTQETLKRCEALRHHVESMKIPISLKQSLRFTISIGIAEWNTDEDLFEASCRADQNLYSAKRNGRNRIAA